MAEASEDQASQSQLPEPGEESTLCNNRHSFLLQALAQHLQLHPDRIFLPALAQHLQLRQACIPLPRRRPYKGCACASCRRLERSAAPIAPEDIAFSLPTTAFMAVDFARSNNPSWAIGNINCMYNAQDRNLRCAVNPTGDCATCSHFRDRRKTGETPVKATD
jgi:hypothetical protein